MSQGASAVRAIGVGALVALVASVLLGAVAVAVAGPSGSLGLVAALLTAVGFALGGAAGALMARRSGEDEAPRVALLGMAGPVVVGLVLTLFGTEGESAASVLLGLAVILVASAAGAGSVVLVGGRGTSA